MCKKLIKILKEREFKLVEIVNMDLFADSGGNVWLMNMPNRIPEDGKLNFIQKEPVEIYEQLREKGFELKFGPIFPVVPMVMQPRKEIVYGLYCTNIEEMLKKDFDWTLEFLEKNPRIQVLIMKREFGFNNIKIKELKQILESE